MGNYNVETLIAAVQDYLVEESEWRLFVNKTWQAGYWELIPADKRERYIKYQERSQAAYNAVVMMCKLIDADVDAVIAAAKAINRYEKNHGKYDRCVHYFYNVAERIRRHVNKNSDEWTGYYRSTGRKIAA